jgi:hypothetical protein
MGIITQPADGYGHLMFPAGTLFAYTLLEFVTTVRDTFFPASYPIHPIHPVMRLPPSRVVLPVHLTSFTSNGATALAGCIFLVFAVIVTCLARWFFQCAARSKADVHDSQSPPSLSSLPAGRGEREESLAIEADFDEMDYEVSDGEDDEADGDGDGDDYPADDLVGELEQEAKDALSSPEDPVPPPDPPTQTAPADDDSNAKGVPLWYLILLTLFTMTTLSLLRWSFIRIRRSLGRIKVYTGSSIFNLFIYVEDPTCQGLVHTAAISSLAGGAGFAAPFQLEDYDTVRQAVELDSATIWDVLVLPPVLKIVGALFVLAVGVLVDMYWRAREAVDGELVISFSWFLTFFCSLFDYFQIPQVEEDADAIPVMEEEVHTVSLFTF